MIERGHMATNFLCPTWMRYAKGSSAGEKGRFPFHGVVNVREFLVRLANIHGLTVQRKVRRTGVFDIPGAPGWVSAFTLLAQIALSIMRYKAKRESDWRCNILSDYVNKRSWNWLIRLVSKGFGESPFPAFQRLAFKILACPLFNDDFFYWDSVVLGVM